MQKRESLITGQLCFENVEVEYFCEEYVDILVANQQTDNEGCNIADAITTAFVQVWLKLHITSIIITEENYKSDDVDKV
jgi:hypothetical protein